MKKDKETTNLIEEGTAFGDILLGDFFDSFQNLSMKEHLFLDFDKVSKPFNFYCTTKRKHHHHTQTITKLSKFLVIRLVLI